VTHKRGIVSNTIVVVFTLLKYCNFSHGGCFGHR